MEPFSIASGAVGIISLGITVAQGLYQVAEGIGSAGQEVRGFAEEIHAFSKLLNIVKKDLERTNTASPDIQSILKDVFHLCDRVLQPLNHIQNSLRPLLEKYKNSPRKLRHLVLKVKWVFTTKEKVLFYREALKHQHGILDTVLDTMNHQATTENTQLLQLMIRHSATPIHLSHKASQRVGMQGSVEPSPQSIAADGAMSPSSPAGVGLLEGGPVSTGPPVSTLYDGAKMTFQTGSANPLQNDGVHPYQFAEASSSLQHEAAPSGVEDTNPSQGDPATSGLGAPDGPFKAPAVVNTLCTVRHYTGEEFQKEMAMLDGKIQSELDSESKGTTRDMREDIRVLERKVLRIATEVLQTDAVPGTRAKKRPTFTNANISEDDIDFSDYTIGVICSGSLETEAMRCFLGEEHTKVSGLSPTDPNQYILGHIRRHDVVIASLPDDDISIASAAVLASNMRDSFPKLMMGLMLETGGGVPSLEAEIFLGDVVVGWPKNESGGVLQYAYTQRTEHEDIRRLGFLNQPLPAMMAAAENLRSQYETRHAIVGKIANRLKFLVQAGRNVKPRLMKKVSSPPDRDLDVLFQPDYPHDDTDIPCQGYCDLAQSAARSRPDAVGKDRQDRAIGVHYGLIASGDLEIRDAMLRDRLGRQEGALCVEMAAAGLMNYVPTLVVCGISHYSDSHQSHHINRWRGYASMTAAAYACELLARLRF